MVIMKFKTMLLRCHHESGYEFFRGCVVAAVAIAGFSAGSNPRTSFAQKSATDEPVLMFTGHGGWPTGLHGPVKGVAFSPNGKRIASGGQDRVVRVWDAADGQELLALKGYSGPVETVKFSPDGKWLASGGYYGTVQLWDALTGRESRTFTGTSGVVRCLSFSPDGKLLVSSSGARLNLWRVEMGQPIASLKVEGMLFDVSFSPDGKRLATYSSQAVVTEWDIASGEQRHSLKALLDRATARFDYQIENYKSNFVYAIAYRPDGKQLAAASSDGVVRVWNLKSSP